ncbi:MAG: DNA repair protein RecO [Granulosicoccus sp.]|nr:DNA repair protein RecO [Granulosicoccus sp.]
MSQSDLSAAYVLHYSEYRDTSFIVEFFTLNHGRLSLMARGGRSGKSRTRALYQPFRPLLISFVGDSEFKTLSHIEGSGTGVELLSEPLACAYYLNELLIRLLPKGQTQSMLFAHYAVALAELETIQKGSHAQNGATAQHEKQPERDMSEELEIVLRTFELQLLEAIGLSPDFKHCTADSSLVDKQAIYRFFLHNSQAIPVPEERMMIEKTDPMLGAGVHADGVTSEKGIEISGRTLHAISELDFTDTHVRAEAKVLMRNILRLHLGDQPLKSRKMFSSYTSSRTAQS